MKTVIRNKTTGKYLEANGSWTSDPAQALGFVDALAAIEAVQVYKLAGVQMVILMADQPGKYDVVVGLTDFHGALPS